MKPLTPITATPSIDWFDEIRAAKRSQDVVTSLEAVRPSVVTQYALLDAATDGDQAAAIVADAGCTAYANALRHCYNSPTAPFLQLTQTIRRAQPAPLLKYCPSCGTTLPRSIDHYLPKEAFPEFSVHPHNLVPCCATCNSAKGARLVAADGRRMFRNAYRDDWSGYSLVRAVLYTIGNPATVGATFELVDPGDPDLWRLAQSHFRELRLLERYGEIANDEIAEILSTLLACRLAGPGDIRAFLTNLAIRTEFDHGLSHWRAPLMRAMAAHPDLDAWVDEMA